MREQVENSDRFGDSLTAGDFNGDSRFDLAIGAPDEDFAPNQGRGGVVHALYGATGGLAAPGNQLWYQDSPGIRDATDVGDRFGHTVASGGH